MRILILGGYGVFGGRLAELLGSISTIEMLICGRSFAKAEQFCEAFSGRAVVRPVALDRADIVEGLHTLGPDVVVDASGPFQSYGTDRYSVVRACISANIDYLDFADAADFVFGIQQFDEQAKLAGVFVLAGVSSFPVLTAAVLREMARDMDILKVEGGIAPSPHAGIGLNVMRAVVSYAGAPVKLLRGGAQSHGIGLAESLRFTVAVPGKMPLHNIHFSLVDVPDLQVIPSEHPAMTDIWMGAGPVPEFLHRALNLLAKARSRFSLPSLVPLSRLFYWVLNLAKFGEHRGGMFVRASGIREGQKVAKSWHLLAEGNDGPYIPSMAIEAIIRKLLVGQKPSPGARSGINALELSDYDRLFEQRTIFNGFRMEETGKPIYCRILGSAFATLPPTIQSLHNSKERRTWTGTAQVRGDRGIMARTIRALFGFPHTQGSVSASVTFTPEQDGELWTRNFDGRIFSSLQTCGNGRDDCLLVERFGLAEFSIALVVENEKLYLIPRSWKFMGIPMPKALLPSGTSFEAEENGAFCFNVEIMVPFVGLLIAYEGSLAPVQPSCDAQHSFA